MFEYMAIYGLHSVGSLVLFFLSMFVLHFVADFMMQTDNIAKGKSTSNTTLAVHVSLYTLPFLLIFGPGFAAITFASHFVTDYFSSRLASKMYAENRRHDFFVVIGADQLLHTLQLILTFFITFYIFGIYLNI